MGWRGWDQQTLAGTLREFLEDAMDPGDTVIWLSVKGQRALYQFRNDWKGLMVERKPLVNPRDHAFNTSQPTRGAGVDMPQMYTQKGVVATRANSEEWSAPSGVV